MRAALSCGLLSFVACTNPADEHLWLASMRGQPDAMRTFLREGMADTPKRIKRLLHEQAGRAHEEELRLLRESAGDVMRGLDQGNRPR
jgi:hypothetical protein